MGQEAPSARSSQSEDASLFSPSAGQARFTSAPAFAQACTGFHRKTAGDLLPRQKGRSKLTPD
jgi:hypothetical protein